MKKFVKKVTTEFTYDEKGYLLKEVSTTEEYEVDTSHTCVCRDNIVTSGTITTNKIGNWHKATALPSTAMFSEGSTKEYTLGEGDLKFTSSTISEIASQVKAMIEQEIERGVRKSQLKGGKPC